MFGTRPEAIKLAPLIRELRSRGRCFEVHLCSTGQHQELLDDALDALGLTPDTELGLMQPDQRPPELLARAIVEVTRVVDRLRPDVVVVQGDTTSTLAGAWAAYYARVPIAHVEAGLRSGDPLAPFPEEQHRAVVDRLSRWLFAPTATAKANLLAEGIPLDRIHVTGNTGIDALNWLRRRGDTDEEKTRLETRLAALGIDLEDAGRLVVATVHRREQLFGPLEEICAGLRAIAASEGVTLVMPIHPNPAIRTAVDRALGSSNVHRIPALDPVAFVGLVLRSALVVTDSGGLQEEATTLGVPTLIVRAQSDRPESLEVGNSRLVGHDAMVIAAAARRLLDTAPSQLRSRELFGDGRASIRIADTLAVTDDASADGSQRSGGRS